MNWGHTSIAMLLLVGGGACVAAHAEGSGAVVVKGKSIALKDAYAFKHADHFDKSKTITTVVLSDKPIDAAKINASSDREKELGSVLRALDATSVELNIDAEGNVENVNTSASGSSMSQSGSGWYKLVFTRNDGKRIEGMFRSTDEKEKKDLEHGYYYDLKFAVDVPGAPNLGAALPPDGGEPAKVYKAYNAALVRGDVDAVGKFLTHDRAEQMLSHRKDADFKAMFGFIQESALRDPKVAKGYLNGDRATLEVSGKDGSGHTADGTATLVKEGSSWHVAEESVTSHMH